MNLVVQLSELSKTLRQPTAGGVVWLSSLPILIGRTTNQPPGLEYSNELPS
jgi:hypothetical protein